MKSTLTLFPECITRSQRESIQHHQGMVLWFTGLSGSGKSTLAHAVEMRLHQQGCRTFVLDGDNLRQGLCRDLGFSASDRQENIRRVGEVAKLFLESGTIVCTAFISPFVTDRNIARSLVAPDNFIEIYCQAPLSVCEARDIKGLYQKARRGEISHFTGIDSPYEPPQHPELVLDTTRPVDACIDTIMALLKRRGIIQITSSELQ